jgi:hypothetical protein
MHSLLLACAAAGVRCSRRPRALPFSLRRFHDRPTNKSPKRHRCASTSSFASSGAPPVPAHISPATRRGIARHAPAARPVVLSHATATRTPPSRAAFRLGCRVLGLLCGVCSAAGVCPWPGAFSVPASFCRQALPRRTIATRRTIAAMHRLFRLSGAPPTPPDHAPPPESSRHRPHHRATRPPRHLHATANRRHTHPPLAGNCCTTSIIIRLARRLHPPSLHHSSSYASHDACIHRLCTTRPPSRATYVGCACRALPRLPATRPTNNMLSMPRGSLPIQMAPHWAEQGELVFVWPVLLLIRCGASAPVPSQTIPSSGILRGCSVHPTLFL